jgi:DNA primase
LAGVIQIQMPENEDVNSLFVKNGSQWFEERIENEVNV